MNQIPTMLECERCGRDFEGMPSSTLDLCLTCIFEEAHDGSPVCRLELDSPIPYVLAAEASS